MESKQHILALKKKRYENQQFSSFCSQLSNKSPAINRPSFVEQNKRRRSIVGEHIASKLNKMNKIISEKSFNRQTSLDDCNTSGGLDRHKSNGLLQKCHQKLKKDTYYAKNEY